MALLERCADDAGELRGEHAVEPTGIAGRKAIEQLNAPVERIEQFVFGEVGKTSSRIVSPRWIRRERLKTATPEMPKVRNSTSPSSCQSSLWLRASVKRARTRRPSNVLSAARSPTTVAETGQRMGRSEVRGRRNVSAIPVGLPPVAIITACACRVSFLRGHRRALSEASGAPIFGRRAFCLECPRRTVYLECPAFGSFVRRGNVGSAD